VKKKANKINTKVSKTGDRKNNMKGKAKQDNFAWSDYQQDFPQLGGSSNKASNIITHPKSNAETAIKVEKKVIQAKDK